MNRSVVGWLLVVVQFLLLLGRPARPVARAVDPEPRRGGAVFAAGAVLGLAAGRRLGRALTPTPVPIAGAGLRIDGAYRYVRHPIYSAVLLMCVGYAIAIGSLWSWIWGPSSSCSSW